MHSRSSTEDFRFSSPAWRSGRFMRYHPATSVGREEEDGWWTFPYFSCVGHRWMLSYVAPLKIDQQEVSSAASA